MVVRSATLRDVWDHMLLFEMPREILFGPILVLANIFLLAINLWPHQISIGGSKIASDGLGLLNAVLMPEKTANDLRGSFFLLETNHLGTSSQYEQALRVCEQGLQQFPSHSSLRHLLPACHFLLRDYARARQLWLRLLAEASPDPEHRLIYLKNIVTVDLLIGDLHLLGEADAFSSEAFLCAPWDHRMYRGAVLIELGRIDEGVALIRAALPKAKTPVPKTWGHSYLALAAARKGQEEQCRSHLVEARRFDESCRVIEAVEKKMKGPEVA